MSDPVTETALCCMIVSNPSDLVRPPGWQKRVNDHMRAQRDRIAALEAERDRLRAALEPFSAAYADALSHFIDRPVTFGVLGAIACRNIAAQDFSNAHRRYSETEAKP
jgi:hypothetical protein